MLISAIDQRPTSEKYFDNLFPNIELHWKDVYLNTHKGMLLFKIKKKIPFCVLYLNKKLLQFVNTQPPFHSFCHTEAETTLHVFHKCLVRKFFGINFCYCLRQILTYLAPEVQKQLSRVVLRKGCSGNMQQIYRRTPMPKYDLNKVALQLTLLKLHSGMGVLL